MKLAKLNRQKEVNKNAMSFIVNLQSFSQAGRRGFAYARSARPSTLGERRRQDAGPSLGLTRGNIMRPILLDPPSLASGRKSLFFGPTRGKVMHPGGNFMSPVATDSERLGWWARQDSNL